MRKCIVIPLFVLLSILLAACGANAATPITASYVVTSNPVNITLSTNPNPPARGEVELVFTLTDADGNPIEGASVEVSADHTDMSGMTMSGRATEQGGGRYAITANFSMSGNWKLTVYIRKEGLEYSEEIDLNIR